MPIGTTSSLDSLTLTTVAHNTLDECHAGESNGSAEVEHVFNCFVLTSLMPETEDKESMRLIHCNLDSDNDDDESNRDPAGGGVGQDGLQGPAAASKANKGKERTTQKSVKFKAASCLPQRHAVQLKLKSDKKK